MITLCIVHVWGKKLPKGSLGWWWCCVKRAKVLLVFLLPQSCIEVHSKSSWGSWPCSPE